MRLHIAALLLTALAASAQTRTVAITVDDMPIAAGGPGDLAVRVNDTLTRAFQRRGIRAVGFVNEAGNERIGPARGKRILEQWIARGHELGNHTYSHPDLSKISADAFIADVIRGEATFRPLVRGPLYLRFPFNHAGDTEAKRDAVQQALDARGYRIAVCTIENTDYLFSAAYERMHQRGDKASAERLRADYLAHTGAVIDWYTKLHVDVFGREIPHVMLLHANRLNADVIEPVLRLFEARGFRFVTLAEAQSDPAYATPDGPPQRFGPMWGYRWAKATGIKVNGAAEPEPPGWITKYTGANTR